MIEQYWLLPRLAELAEKISDDRARYMPRFLVCLKVDFYHNKPIVRVYLESFDKEYSVGVHVYTLCSDENTYPSERLATLTEMVQILEQIDACEFNQEVEA